MTNLHPPFKKFRLRSAILQHDIARVVRMICWLAVFTSVSGFTATLTNQAGAQFSLSAPAEPPGPSSRRTALVITEIMYHPRATWPGGEDLEFVELWNSGIITEDLTGHRLEGEIDFTFPDGTKLPPGQFLVIAKNPPVAQSFYGVNCLGPFSGKLNNSGGALRLLNELGGRLLDINYSHATPWPAAADGTGHSLVLKRPSYGENDPRAWDASDVIGGSPGAQDPSGNEPARTVAINEILAHTDPPQEDSVELFNTGTQPVDVSGCWLSDDAAVSKYRIADGMTIPARGFLSFTQTQLGFAFSADGESVFLVNSNQTRVLDAVTFGGQENGVSFGRYPDGAAGFQRLNSVTLGSANTAPLISPVVINEIMYHPISEMEDDEYIELYNRSSNPISLGGWQLQDAVDFTFPPNAVIPAGGYVVIAKNAERLFSKYPNLNSANTYGNFSGKLSNSGERVALAKPDDLVANGVTNFFQIVVNEVAWSDGGRWGKWSDGGGSSLELKDPRADNRLAANWADSDESAKAGWTTINVTNVLENGQASVDEGAPQGVPNRFDILSLDAGEVLLDNIEFRNNNGPNLIPNDDFGNGIGGWIPRGVVRNSYVQSGAGIGGSPALHLVAVARGDTGPNKIYTPLLSTVTTGQANTGIIRASARWLKGSPYILFRIRGNWMEVSQRLNVPDNCGTPCQPNSQLIANAGPAITEVTHSPVLPSSGQSVVVSARVTDPDGIGNLVLKYRVDPALTFASVPMLDDGTGGDEIAGDGIFSATIPAQLSGKLVAFHVVAADAAGSPATSLFPSDAPARECLVHWGEFAIGGHFGAYRLWVTSSNITFWTNREKNANDPIDATFVYGNSRVVYNVETMYSGSPFHAPNYEGPLGSVPPDFEVNFPPDDRLLGSEPFVLSAYQVGGGFFFNDPSAQVDITGTWIGRKLGQQYNYRRHIRMFLNGSPRGTIYDDTQQPNSEMVEEYFPDDENGDLRKIESWFEFADDGLTQGSTYATIDRFNQSNGAIDPKRYRWNWRPRVTSNPNNWFNLTNLIVAANSANVPNFVERLKLWMDIPNFLRPIITHHVCSSWDSYAYSRGKNMYAYKPDHQPWRLLLWDIELSLGADGNSPTDSIYTMFDKTLLNIILNNPEIHREYLRGFKEAVDGPLAPGVADVALNERFAAFQSEGIGLSAPTSIKNFIAARRAYLQSILPNVTFSLTNAPFQTLSSSNTLVLGGTAPLELESIRVNGVTYPIIWTGITNWKLIVPLASGGNLLSVAAFDRFGNPINNGSTSITANYTGAPITPEGKIVFNELMWHPKVPGAEFVELFNTDSNITFDLSGWRVDGIDYTFPSGATIAPRSFLVLAADPITYNLTYGPANLAFGQYTGSLDPNGETLTLLRPGETPGEELVVNRVRYEAVAPWPIVTNGVSLQLVDAAEDNSRVANWAINTNTFAEPPPSSLALMAYNHSWRYNQTANLDGVNWMAANYNDNAWPVGSGLLAYENNSAIVPLISTTLANPQNGNGSVQSGHAYYFRTTVSLAYSPEVYQFTARARVDDGAIIYVNGVEVQRIRMSAGAVFNASMASELPNNGDTLVDDVFTIPSSAFTTGVNVIAVEIHQFNSTSTDIVFGMKLDATFVDASPLLATPGRANNVITNLPAFPPLWLNELQAVNVTGPLDNFGQQDPWVELFNTAPTNFSLDGYYLSDNYTNLTQWAFPSGMTIGAHGFTQVWCDNQSDQSAGDVAHASFVLSPGAGRLALSRLVNGQPQLVDYLTYTNLPANWSYGDVPDGQPFYRNAMFYVTPGATNNGASAPIQVYINEWMADNSATLTDSADSSYEDWFELFNPGTSAVDLGGYYLTDDLLDPFKFQIPNNGQYVIPAGGYLLVWADNESEQNSPSNPDLHVDFALGKGGEAIGLFAADGATVDAITFGAQTTDISEGRFPDGAENIYPMPNPTPRAANVIPGSGPAPSMAGVSLSSNGFVSKWNVTAGQKVVLEFCDDLAGAQWTEIGSTVAGTGGVLSFTNNVDDAPLRFFRLRVVVP